MLGYVRRSAFCVVADACGNLAQHVFVLHSPDIKAAGCGMPGLRRRSSTDGSDDEGEDLRDGGAVEHVLVIGDDVQIRHAHVVEDGSRIVRDVKKDEGLSRADVSILYAFADHVGEELGDDGGDEGPRREGEALAVLIDVVPSRLDLGCQPGNALVLALLVWWFVFDGHRRSVGAA